MLAIVVGGGRSAAPPRSRRVSDPVSASSSCSPPCWAAPTTTAATPLPSTFSTTFTSLEGPTPGLPHHAHAVQPSLGDRAPGDPNLSDAFLTKVDRSGSSLGYSTYLGGSDYDQGVGIAVDHRFNVYVTGVTSSADFPTTEALQANLRGNANGFVTKFNFLWG